MVYAIAVLALLLSVSGIFNFKQHGEIEAQHDTIVLTGKAVQDCGESVAKLRASVDDQRKQIADLKTTAQAKNAEQDKKAQQALHAVPRHAPPVRTVEELNSTISGWQRQLGGS